jgi:hypothetical protein
MLGLRGLTEAKIWLGQIAPFEQAWQLGNVARYASSFIKSEALGYSASRLSACHPHKREPAIGVDYLEGFTSDRLMFDQSVSLGAIRSFVDRFSLAADEQDRWGGTRSRIVELVEGRAS